MLARSLQRLEVDSRPSDTASAEVLLSPEAATKPKLPPKYYHPGKWGETNIYAGQVDGDVRFFNGWECCNSTNHEHSGCKEVTGPQQALQLPSAGFKLNKSAARKSTAVTCTIEGCTVVHRFANGKCHLHRTNAETDEICQFACQNQIWS